MHAPTTQARRAKRPACNKREKLTYPELPEPGDGPRVVFWLSAAQIDEAELDALNRLRRTPLMARRCNADMALNRAIAGAQSDAEDELKKSVNNLVSLGGLLFFWTGTTATKPGAVQACAQAFGAEAAA